MEVRAARAGRLVFDAGTGIRLLGRGLASEAEPTQAELFLTHFHWDHIQGFPYFGPLYEDGASLRIHGPDQSGLGAESLLAGLMAPSYFPTPFRSLSTTLSFRRVDGTPYVRDGVEVAAMRVQHAGHTYGYRLRSGAASMAYIPDNELAMEGRSPELGLAWGRELVSFLDGVDLLLHDTTYTEAEYAERVGWGHSTYAQALRLAEEAGVRRLCLFHHAPDRTDAELEAILTELRDIAARAARPVEVMLAAEGEELTVGESEP